MINRDILCFGHERGEIPFPQGVGKEPGQVDVSCLVDGQ